MVSFGLDSEYLNDELSSENDVEENDFIKCKIYLSYEWKSFSKIKKIHDQLNNYECLDVFMDAFKIQTGMKLVPTLIANIQQTDIVLACVTREYVRSENCKKEINYCDDLKKYIIPLYIEKIPIPELAPLGIVLARERYCELSKRDDIFDQMKIIIEAIEQTIRSEKIATTHPITSVLEKRIKFEQSSLSQSVLSFRNGKPLPDIIKSELKQKNSSLNIYNTRATQQQLRTRATTKNSNYNSIKSKAKEINDDDLLDFDFTPPKKRTEYILEVHPVIKEVKILLRPKILLDPSGDRSSFKSKKNLNRGGEKYYPPVDGWVRYGLDVKSLFSDISEWLSNDGNPEEWCVGYHGFKSNQLKLALLSKLFDKTLTFHPKFTQSKKTIYENEKDINKKSPLFGKPCGKGIFCSQKPELAEENTSSFILNDVKYKLLLQCRIDPTKIRIPQSNTDLYIINSPENVRPYGLLIKEILE